MTDFIKVETAGYAKTFAVIVKICRIAWSCLVFKPAAPFPRGQSTNGRWMRGMAKRSIFAFQALSKVDGIVRMKDTSHPSARVAFPLLISLVLALAGCSDAKKRTESSGNLKQLSSAIIAYHESKKAWPDSLEQIKPLIGKEGPIGIIGGGMDFATLIQNPLTGANPGYEYVKPAGRAASGVVLYQLKGGARDTSLPAAYADGSVH